MIKALLLLLRSVPTWEDIVSAGRGLAYLVLVQFCPLLLLYCGLQGYYLTHYGISRGLVPRPHIFPASEIIIFEAAQFLFWCLILAVDAAMIKSFGDTFHGRHNYRQTFTVAVYSLSPFFLLRMLGIFIPINPWIIFFIAMLFALGALYNGLPRVMLPDPPHAFGLFLMSAILVSLTSGIAQAMANWYLAGKFPKLENVFQDWATHLHF